LRFLFRLCFEAASTKTKLNNLQIQQQQIFLFLF